MNKKSSKWHATKEVLDSTTRTAVENMCGVCRRKSDRVETTRGWDNSQATPTELFIELEFFVKYSM